MPCSRIGRAPGPRSGARPVAFLAVAAVVVAAVMSCTASADTQSRVAPVAAPAWATHDRLVLPEHFDSIGELRFVPHRARRETWSDEDISEHWLDPRDIGLEVLDARVEEYIRNLLGAIP